MSFSPELLGPDRLDDVVTVLCEAFHDYPVMRFVVGPGERNYDRRLRELVHFFVMRSVRQDGPMLGMVDDGTLVAAATVTFPGRPDVHEGAESDRDRLWEALGDEARLRYETYKAASKPIEVSRPHHYLNLIGVRTSHLGRGLSRPLLEEVRRCSDEDSESEGVGLTTELARNVPLYEHFGYGVVGHVKVVPALECWSLFLPSASTSPPG